MLCAGVGLAILVPTLAVVAPVLLLISRDLLVGGLREAATMDREQTVLINMSGRGDKDIFTIADALDDAKWKE